MSEPTPAALLPRWWHRRWVVVPYDATTGERLTGLPDLPHRRFWTLKGATWNCAGMQRIAYRVVYRIERVSRPAKASEIQDGTNS